MTGLGDRGPEGSGPLITISVVSHGNARELGNLLSGLLEHEETDRIQLLVTDNFGDDLADLDDSRWEQLHIIRNRRSQGLACNHNAAFRLAKGRYFCMLNPDVVPVQKIFPALLRHLEAGDASIVAPLVVDSRGIPQDTFRNLPNPVELIQRRLQRSLGMPELSASPGPILPEWIAGVFLLMKREVFAELGGLDEKYRLYFEDVDFCTRARLKGHSLLVDKDLVIQHDANRSSRRDTRYMFWHLQSAFRFFTSVVYRQASRRRSRSA